MNNKHMREDTQQVPVVVSNPPADECYVMPCSFNQERLWLLDQLMPGSSAYNVLSPLRIYGLLDVTAFIQTLNEIVHRHEALRTTFDEDNGEPVQVIWPELSLDIPLVDLTDVPASDRERTLEELMTIEGSQPFDLKSGPLCRAQLYVMAPDDHALFWNMHHIVSDGWSYTVLMQEIEAIYPAFSKKLPCPLPELPIQYADYALWQREQLSGDRLKLEVEHWREKLSGAPESLNLPTDHPRAHELSTQGYIQTIWLPEDLCNALRLLCQREGATIFMTTFAAFFILLWRYSSQEDIVVGTAAANRGNVELENLIGFFVNMLPIRSKIDANIRFHDFLDQIRTACVESYNHQGLPLDKLVMDLRLKRDTNRSPIFQVMFLCHEAFIQPPKIPGLEMSHIHIDRHGSPYDITLFLIERDNKIRCSIEYDTSLFDRTTIARMLENYKVLLQDAVLHPEAKLQELKVISPNEQSLILVEWNNTERGYRREETIHGLFEKQVQRTASKVAVRCGDDTLTYEQLDHRASRLAAKLRLLGVKPGDAVGLFVERSLDMVVGLLGILKSDAAYVPMDPAFPAERLGYMVEDAEMPVIVTQKSVVGQLPHHNAKVVLMDEEMPETTIDSRSEDSGNLAYVIFTSGSTGRPKGVRIPHQAVVNFLNSMRREPGLTADDVLLAVTTLSFDIACLEIFLPLTTGATLVVATRETASDGNLLCEALQRTGATVMQATPISWRMLLEAGWNGNPGLKILIGGEAVPRDLVNQLIPRAASVWNMYGPTETTIWSTVARLEAGEGPVSIGRPIDNTQVYIVSPGIQLQPVGVTGELLIGGDGLALGYLKQPELTSEKFVDDPFSGRIGAKLYRTGDLAKWHADGTLECLGRIDHQVKIRGFRIELGEIEATLSKLDEVSQCVVTVREDRPGDQRLVAYYVTKAGNEANIPEWRNYLRSRLPEYMIPQHFVKLEAMTLTPNGKIDRKALPASDAVITTPMEHVAPRNPIETKILNIFAKVLEKPDIGVTDNFFESGGHSLLAVRLVSMIEKEFRCRIPLATLFNSPDVERIADILRSRERVETIWNSLVPIFPDDTKRRIFLIHGAGGNLLLYRTLAKHLSANMSVYGFQSQGLDGKSRVLTSVEEMAAHYVKELKSFQDVGPYYLCGYCMGGVVAYEMARILRSENQTIGMVAMLDSYNLNAARELKLRARKFSFLRQKIGFHIGNLGQLNARDLFGYFSEKLRMAEEAGLGKLAATIVKLRNRLKGFNGGHSSEIFIQEINHQAAWGYVPGPFNGKVTLFKPQKNYDFFPDPRMGWGDVVLEELEVLEIPVNPHAMLLEPYVESLAVTLTEHIATKSQPIRHK
jgi:amino acid adenylation domain-containing protein